MFSDDEGLGREELFGAGTAEEREGGFVLGLGFVGWVEEDNVERGGELGEVLEEGSCAAVFDGVGAGDFERGEGGAEGS